MRTVVSYEDLPHNDVAIDTAQPHDTQQKKKRARYVGAHWDDVNVPLKQPAPAWSHDDDDAIIASPSRSPPIEPVILPGTGVPLDSSEIWDDRFLVDVWEAAEREYAAFHQRRSHALDSDTKWARLGDTLADTQQDTPGWIDAQRLIAETAQRSNRKQDTRMESPSTTQCPVPPCAPPFPDDEALQNLVMAWYYTGYYTAMYQKK